MICAYFTNSEYKSEKDMELKDCIRAVENSHISAMKQMINTEKAHVLYAISLYDDESKLCKQMIFKNTCLSDSELDDYINQYPQAIFHVIHAGSKLACKKILKRRENREIRPITLKIANEYVNKYHRHHKGTVGCKYAIGLYENNELIGVAICGRPVSRILDNGEICEINRLCTRGGENACSTLYGACSRIARDMGYKKIITYILESESGTTLKASNFICEGKAGGTHWTGKRNKGQNIPCEMKTRWSKTLAV